mgnify:FL=1
MGNRIIRLLWDEAKVVEHPDGLADSPYLLPFDIPYEIYDETTGKVESRWQLQGCYLSRITVNDDTGEHAICTPIEVTDFFDDAQPWHIVNTEMVSDDTKPKGPLS